MPSGDIQVKNRGKPHRWLPGESGNKNGRPRKDCSITSAVKAELDSVPPVFEGKKNKLTWRQLIRDSWLQRAAKGDQGALFTLLERIEGKVTQPIAGEGGKPILIKVVYDDRNP